MYNYFWLILFVLVCHQPFLAQKDTATIKIAKQTPLVQKIIVPAALIFSGIALTATPTEKFWQKNIRNKVGNNYHNGADDYIQYIPYAQIYLGDMIGIKAKNHWFDQTKNIFLGGLATLVITHTLKKGVGKERPDASSNRSFSSGHTATAFLGGTILYHEYKESSMLYASSGYLFSASTGGLRVMNNRHWVSDVLAGAGIGILVGNLIYHFEPLKNWNPFKKTKNITFSPMIHNEGFSFAASFQF